jgi:hypothetical protein
MLWKVFMCISEVKCIHTRSLFALVGDTLGNLSPVHSDTKTGSWNKLKMFLNKFFSKYPFRGAFRNGGERLLFSCLSVCTFLHPSVRPSARYNSSLSGGIFTKLNIWISFENLTRNFNITVTVHEQKYTFFITSHAVLLRTINVSDKFAEKITHAFYVK